MKRAGRPSLKLLQTSLLFGVSLLIACTIIGNVGVFGGQEVVAPPEANRYASAVAPELEGAPQTVSVPELGLNLAVADGVYDSTNHSWSLDFDHAHFATVSARPNITGGNTFVYGHNTQKIFGKLSQLSPQGQVVISTNTGIKFYYALDEVTDITPESVTFLNYSGPPILTIQTCSGNWNEKRRMFQFVLLRSEQPA